MADPAYPPEYRDQLIALLRTGRTPEDVAAEFGLPIQTIRAWATEAKIGVGRAEGISSDKAELAQLRRENIQLREDREILRKTVALFARESSR